MRYQCFTGRLFACWVKNASWKHFYKLNFLIVNGLCIKSESTGGRSAHFAGRCNIFVYLTHFTAMQFVEDLGLGFIYYVTMRLKSLLLSLNLKKRKFLTSKIVLCFVFLPFKSISLSSV